MSILNIVVCLICSRNIFFGLFFVPVLWERGTLAEGPGLAALWESLVCLARLEVPDQRQAAAVAAFLRCKLTQN